MHTILAFQLRRNTMKLRAIVLAGLLLSQTNSSLPNPSSAPAASCTMSDKQAQLLSAQLDKLTAELAKVKKELAKPNSSNIYNAHTAGGMCAAFAFLSVYLMPWPLNSYDALIKSAYKGYLAGSILDLTFFGRENSNLDFLDWAALGGVAEITSNASGLSNYAPGMAAIFGLILGKILEIYEIVGPRKDLTVKMDALAGDIRAIQELLKQKQSATA
jgi:hypothetical protein